MNIVGLISGNFKRHLVSKHGYGQLIFDLFGDRLFKMGDKDCPICKAHTELLKEKG